MSMNPFQPTKFELENNPKIWLNPRAKKLIEAKKPSFVFGTRGSGKTTLLRSLHTKEILSNTILRGQFRQAKLKWFGAYLQFNHNLQFITEMVLNTLSSKDETKELRELKHYKTFCAYFEISLLDSIVGDLLHLESQGVLHFSGKKERQACLEISALFPNISTKEAYFVTDYGDLRRLMRSLRAAFTAVFDKDKINAVGNIVDSFAPGTILRLIREQILPSIHCKSLAFGEDLGLVILLDDCESLSTEQQVALNTYLKSNEGVGRWIIAHVRGQYNTSETFLPDTYLNYADRDVAAIDELNDAEFSGFCENVATLRLSSFLSDNSPRASNGNDTVRLDTFGHPSYNSLVNETISGYESAAIRAFKKSVESFRNTVSSNFKEADKARFSMRKGDTPYVEYISAEIGKMPLADLAADNESVEGLKKRIHRKEAAAYVFACHLCGRSPTYAGGRFVLWASDGNIRDFLDIMAEFFDAYSGRKGGNTIPLSAAVKTVRRFFDDKSLVAIPLQDEVLKRVSKRSLKSIEDLKNTSEPYLYRLMSGLVDYVKLLQTDISNTKAIATPERGLFRVSCNIVDASSKQPGFEKTIRRLERDGFIIVKDVDDVGSERIIDFRLHKRLSPALGISPKGAYEIVTLNPLSLARLLDDRTTSDPARWAIAEHEDLSSIDTRQQKFEI